MLRPVRTWLAGSLALCNALVVLAADGSAAGVSWNVPARWQTAPERPMRAATYTVPAAAGSEAGECGVFFFGKGQGGSVEENLERWEKQFDSAAKPKRSDRTVHGLRVHRMDVSGTYLAPGGPMMQSQGRKSGWRLLGAIVEAPGGLVFFKCVGPSATLKRAEKEFDTLITSLSEATTKA